VVEEGSRRPAARSHGSRNDEALVLRLEYGLASFLLASDIEAAREQALVAAGAPLAATVLKVAHHGSRTSSTPAFLGAVGPAVAVISVGPRNPYGHPDPDVLERLAAAGAIDGAQVVALGEHVDYWDRLGWRDRFSSPAFTARQAVYVRRFNDESAYTPQIVVDGRAGLVGSDASAARRAIAKAAAAPHGMMSVVARETAAAQLTVSLTASNLPPTGGGDHADILVAITEDGLRSDVKGGENSGRALTHAAVVRRLTTIREATDAAASAETTIAVPAEWQRDHLHIVAFVQHRRDRGIVAAASVPLVERP
jgi:hypothetical protein